MEMEPFLQENQSRYVMFPIQYKDIFDMYKQATSSFWVCDELTFGQDLIDLEKKMTSNERQFIFQILAFFSSSDGVVIENLNQRFTKDIKIPEALAFYSFQAAIEAVHSEAYSLMIDTYCGSDEKMKAMLFNAVSNFPAIAEKNAWAVKWVNDQDATFAKRVFAFAIVEGLFFSASFCALFWVRSRGLLPGLSFANQLIARDEGLHTAFACLIYSKLVNRLSPEEAKSMIEEAVDIERRFITESIPCSMIGMNSELMTQYIKYIADRLIVQLGYEKIYHVQNPFTFVEQATISAKQNFFEGRSSEYSLACVNVNGKQAVPDKLSLNTDDDF
jgi:ribonucleoside-diphosphate reductase subunit M2